MAEGVKAVEFSAENFESEVLNSKIPVFVDFYAIWCGPCHAFAPSVEKLASELAGKLKVGKVDIDKSPSLADKYGVKSIPTFIVFKGGAEAGRDTGAHPYEALKAWVAQAL